MGQKPGSVVVTLVLGPARSLGSRVLVWSLDLWELIRRQGHRGHLRPWELEGTRVGWGPGLLGAWCHGATGAVRSSSHWGEQGPGFAGA